MHVWHFLWATVTVGRLLLSSFTPFTSPATFLLCSFKTYYPSSDANKQVMSLN